VISGLASIRCPEQRSAHRLPADDDVDAVLFEKIRSGEYDADDPIWDSISEQVQASALVRAHVDCITASLNVPQYQT